MATAGKLGSVKICGTGIAFTNEACSLVSGKKYKIANRAKKVWDKLITLTIKDDGSAVAAADILKIDYLIGNVEFVADYTVVGDITASGTYLPTTVVAGIKSYTVSFTQELKSSDTYKTSEDNGGWKEKTITLKSASGSISGFYETTQGFAQMLIDGVRVILELIADRTVTGSYIVDTLLTGVAADTKVEDLNNISLNFESKIEANFE